ncbi:hypothetical protein AB0I60_34600 [Actinosynnema sp. NPDC050436]|uniref:hypothetical protein n=1 Tax=Actinosynnema sp. NPDC050436 TaxID=3155659 RepID=UPI0034078398
MHAKLGFELPSDYRRLLEVFPPGTFHAPDHHAEVIVQPPYLLDGRPDHLTQFEAEIAEAEQWRERHPEDVPARLVPWARSGRPGLFWVGRSSDPEQWTVAVSNGGVWRYDDEPVVEEFDCGAVEFLHRLVTGRLRSRILSPINSRSIRTRPLFEPVDEREWQRFSDTRSPQVRKISLRGYA